MRRSFFVLLAFALFAFRVDSSKVFPLRADAPPGWLLVDLLHEGLCTPVEQLTLQVPPTSELSGWFEVRNHSIYTSNRVQQNATHRSNVDKLHLLEILASRPISFKRIVMVQVEIQRLSSTPRFILDTYSTSVDVERLFGTTPAKMTTLDSMILLNFSQPITIASQTSYQRNIHYEVVTSFFPANFLQLVNTNANGNIKSQAKVFLLRKPHHSEIRTEFFVAAVDTQLQRRLAVARIQVNFQHPVQHPPKFEQSKYVLDKVSVQAHKTLLRVVAKTSKGVSTYRIEPESSPFEVAPIFGDVFPTKPLPNGRYVFEVVAMDSLGQEGRTTIELTVRQALDQNASQSSSRSNTPSLDRRWKETLRFRDKDNLGEQRAGRWARSKSRRDRGEDLIIAVREGHPMGFLEQRVPLHANERITKGISASGDSVLAVHKNGSIELLRELNYEKQTLHQTTVQIDGHFKSRMQTIKLEVIDIDEPPRILNRPVPYLAVVPPDVPFGFQVYRFEARDENGDGNDNVTFHLINTEPPDTFTIDAKTGAVRTAQRQYTAGQSYRVSIQVTDKRHESGDNQTVHLESELDHDQIAVLEVLAGDRPPQFMQPKYVVSIAEDTEIGQSVLQLETVQFRSIRDGHIKSRSTFSLTSDDASTSSSSGSEFSRFFGVEQYTGLIHLLSKLDYDDPKQTKIFKFYGVVREDGRESKVPIEIAIRDVNDNAPQFIQPLYTANVKEDMEIGATVLRVQARDRDSGANAQLDYFVDHPSFAVNENGDISVRLRLDADQKQEGFHFYRFNVTASDRGLPNSLQGSALVQIRTDNTNDEPPMFIPTAEYTASVAEDAQGGTPVVQVQAIDPDGDQVTYWFKEEGTGHAVSTTQMFEIDRDTGLIRLRPNTEPLELLKYESPYNLTVMAMDDGSCCLATSLDLIPNHKPVAHVRISISDVNNNKPSFPNCMDYGSSSIEEGQYRAHESPVIVRAQAVDADAGLNGEIVYSLYYGRAETRKPFVIDPDTGELRPSPYFVFDRESKAKEEVTIKATDKGERPLIGFCQFSVQILDVNDNAPQFDRSLYETSLAKNSMPGSSVLTVLAEDSDSPANAQVAYSLSADETAPVEHRRDHQFFEISNTDQPGEITLVRTIPHDRDRFVFSVIATDNGEPETRTSIVQVVVKVHERQQNAPQWQSTPQCRETSVVYEDIQINTVLIRCYAVVGEDKKRPVSYKLTNAVKHTKNNKQVFREFVEKEGGHDWVVVRNMENLDYEQVTNYSLTLTATDMISSATSEKHFHILVRDKNDEVPRFTVDQFTGTIEEELSPAEYMDKFNGEPIATITAVDADYKGEPQSEIYYRILDDITANGHPASSFFRIDERSGKIFPLEKFDHERNNTFIFDVEARDGMNSNLPYTQGPNKDIVKVQIFVTDLNDNPPTFNQTLYERRVPENIDISQEILTVKAEDLDSQSVLRYSLDAPTKIPFGVKTDTGVIYVKDALDYEALGIYPFYDFGLVVTDGKHNANTNVRVYVDDVNDNAPYFEKQQYVKTIVEEEDESNLPMSLFHLRAMDFDKRETNGRILYGLEGQGVGEFFRVDRDSGRVEVFRPLDRDPPSGMPVWKFIAQAIDSDGLGLIGYADVEVRLEDINDNAPIFPAEQFGTVNENNQPDTYVMTAGALDFDDPATPNGQMRYTIGLNKEINGQPIFRIDPENGKIFAMVTLDRELTSERLFHIQVRATDKGIPPREGVGNVTIRVLDVNDNPPYFEHPLYNVTVPETTEIGSPILTLIARDVDNEAVNNVFTYSFVDGPHEYFYISSDVLEGESRKAGVLRINKPLFPLCSAGAMCHLKVNNCSRVFTHFSGLEILNCLLSTLVPVNRP
ncbi:cadherin domain-containing protein [Ditylenchus destructor]|uniref:Cadherin domain-containing protein n=1 Tax=Ditylenchus destructor TaxID=166010 RepID=A0AAD4NBV4_9BILA|nr:cadherin domain-containing protein [Ditylenchus destructor]